MMHETVELERRSSRLRAEVERWRTALAASREDLFLAESQLRAFVDHVTSRADAVARRLATVDVGDPADRRRLRVRALRDVVRAERAWQAVRYVLAQRRDLDLGPQLQVADLCAADGFEAVMRIAGRAEVVAPAVVLEAFDSPATYPRGRRLDAPSFVTVDLGVRDPFPVPLVLLPTDHLGSIWLYTVLQHEVGHDIAAELGLEADLRVRVETALGAGSRRQDWVAWVPELLADAFGVLLGGTGYAATLDHLLAASSEEHTATHPSPWLRLRVVRHLLHALTAGPPPEPDSDAWSDDASLVVEAMLSTPLGTGTLRGAAPALLPNRPDLVAWLRDGGSLPADVPWRAVPSAAQLAIDAGADGDTVHRRALALTESLDRPAWATSRGKWDFLALVQRQLEPTYRVDGQKRPPVRYLRKYDRIAFVGATHDQLAAMMSEAWPDRVGRKWLSIDLYFLSDAALAPLGHAPDLPVGSTKHGTARTFVDLRAAREGAIAELTRLLPDWTERFALWWYDLPWFFASYWDWDAPGGRIHVSPAVWGWDLREAPGLDFVWAEAEPSPEYLAYRRGLDGLALRRRPIDRPDGLLEQPCWSDLPDP